MTCNSQRKREEEEEGARTGWHGICNIRRIMGFSLMLLLSFFTGAESTSSVLMYHSNECFVSQYYPTTCHGSRRNNPFLSSSLPRKFDPLLFVGTSSKPNRQRKSIILRTSSEPTKSPLPNNTNNNLDDKNFNDPKKIIPTTFMYTIVPLLPSITIQSLNDHYQQLKQQFNIAAAALPPSAPTDSIEYITASNMYNESMQSLLVLLLSKRVALYFLATLATVYAGWRASITIGVIERGDLGGPGMALDYLNREVLKGEKRAWLLDDDDDGGGVGGNNGDDANATVDVGSESEKKVDDDDDNDKLFATLVDDSPQSTRVGGAIAIILPLVLGASLALSYTLISFFKGVGVDGSSISSSIIGDEYLSAIQGVLPYLTSIPSMVLCVLFVATEFRSVSSSSSSSSSSTSTSTSLLHAENVAALLYVAGAYIAKVYPTITIGGEWNLDLGPLQNGVNIAFAATVVRALSPFLISYTSTLDESSSTSSSKMPSISIRTMALALIGVTMFDGISVFGTVANAATVDTTTSVMETVATYKADAQLWNPGLLSVVVGHNQNAKITEALGLGDVVFPACLVAWGFFADAIGTPTNDASDEAGGEMPKRQISYTTATTAGYVLGSAVTEIVGTLSLLGSGRGLPALIFLIPSMLIAVTTVAVSRGELNEVWGRSDVAESNASD
eukprot:scaffold2950_cov93-Skeletonema_menzelii.AAC.12